MRSRIAMVLAAAGVTWSGAHAAEQFICERNGLDATAVHCARVVPVPVGEASSAAGSGTAASWPDGAVRADAWSVVEPVPRSPRTAVVLPEGTPPPPVAAVTLPDEPPAFPSENPRERMAVTYHVLTPVPAPGPGEVLVVPAERIVTTYPAPSLDAPQSWPE